MRIVVGTVRSGKLAPPPQREILDPPLPIQDLSHYTQNAYWDRINIQLFHIPIFVYLAVAFATSMIGEYEI